MRSEGGKMPTLNTQTQSKEEDDLRGEKREGREGRESQLSYDCVACQTSTV